MRLGMFCIDSGEAIATDKLKDLQMLKDKESFAVSEGISKVYGVSNVQKGVWIAGENMLLSLSGAEVYFRKTKRAEMCLEFVDKHSSVCGLFMQVTSSQWTWNGSTNEQMWTQIVQSIDRAMSFLV